MTFNKSAIIFLALVILTGILGPQSFFTVDETQLAIVTRFGDVKQSITSPGLHTKTPFVDTVTYFEKRRTLFDANPDALITADKKRLVIDAYAIGRITDPLLFRETVQTAQRAVTRANDIVASELRSQIANDEQIDIIRDNRESIMVRVREVIEPKLQEFGIETVDVRIKRADFPNEIATAVYARMQAERKRIADAERAAGAQRDLEIRSNVDRQAVIIRAEAERDANILRGEGEAQAVTIFAKALEQDPEFYRFQRTLEAYKNFLTENTTVVLPADSDIFEFLQSPGSVDDYGLTSIPDPLLEIVRGDLTARLAIDEREITLVAGDHKEWQDASLGCPIDSVSYAQILTEGYSVTFAVSGVEYTYHISADGTIVVPCD